MPRLHKLEKSHPAVLIACGLQKARSVAVQALSSVHRSASNYERRGRPETVRRAADHDEPTGTPPEAEPLGARARY